MNEMVSVIAPAYNHERYIESALDSIKNQTYHNKELIVIDDCSKDATPQIIEEYIKRKDVCDAFPGGIRYIRHTENMNAHRTINQGIDLAKGTYIAVINTDDFFEDDRLEEMLKVMEKLQARFAFSRVKIVNAEGVVKEYAPFENMRRKIGIYPTASLILAVENVGISTGNYMFEKNLYYEVGGFDAKYHFIHDWDFILKVSLISEPCYVDTTSYIYRFHDTNTLKQIDESIQMREEKDWEVKSVLENYLNRIANRETTNKMLPTNDAWSYFLNKKEPCLASSIWNEIVQKM